MFALVQHLDELRETELMAPRNLPPLHNQNCNMGPLCDSIWDPTFTPSPERDIICGLIDLCLQVYAIFWYEDYGTVVGSLSQSRLSAFSGLDCATSHRRLLIAFVSEAMLPRRKTAHRVWSAVNCQMRTKP
ncbi:hypothetical protein GUITHDRAFT_133192 [Guillardia theta CCMP2712]|uniref:Uncharacterized protein n=1 Tax=Guillardia theta (strain CCMP2712) TaxID=905079 RepID=L1JZF4_GUITC|nr:hypothetical protein GUITHDRAFT_133192 [Guillardia theta CCMP2712]EKX53488.1 hypothetical protein GUITHDRAFT_133192 [Guillardia theta CCMP2712]|eukprot:XP_005840468.1 hypothetical protein GUITHDRAFT_133192 [Guillardia theta CCMP2712]